MTFRSEFAEWNAELNPPPKPTIAERLALWFAPRSEPERQHMYAWADVADLIPVPEEAP